LVIQSTLFRLGGDNKNRGQNPIFGSLDEQKKENQPVPDNNNEPSEII